MDKVSIKDIAPIQSTGAEAMINDISEALQDAHYVTMKNAMSTLLDACRENGKTISSVKSTFSFNLLTGETHSTSEVFLD